MFTSHVYRTLFSLAQLVKKFFAFLMEYIGSLPCSQKPAVVDSEPDKCSHIVTRYFYKIHYNTEPNRPSTPAFPKWSLLFRFSNWNFLCMLYIPLRSSVFWPSLIWSLLCEDHHCAFPRSSYYALLCSNILFSSLLRNAPNLCFFTPLHWETRVNTHTKLQVKLCLTICMSLQNTLLRIKSYEFLFLFGKRSIVHLNVCAVYFLGILCIPAERFSIVFHLCLV
jgi:hypothetical protein